MIVEKLTFKKLLDFNICKGRRINIFWAGSFYNGYIEKTNYFNENIKIKDGNNLKIKYLYKYEIEDITLCDNGDLNVYL